MTASEINEYNAEWERSRQAAERLNAKYRRPNCEMPKLTGYASEVINREEQVVRLNAEQRLAISELSFIGASPNKIETVWTTEKISVDIFEDTINETKIRYCSTGLIISPANPPDWVKEYVNGVIDPMEWCGDFKRTRKEQENIESYNEKDLV